MKRKHTHMRPHRETTASSELPQIQRFLQSGAELSFSAHFLSHLPQPLSVDLCHVDARLDCCWIILECLIVFWGSSHWLPSWLQSLLSTKLKTNSSWPGETPGRHLFLWSGNGESRFVLLEVVVFLSCLGPGPWALSGPGWQSGERRLPGCQLELLAGAASGPAVHRHGCRCQGRLPSPCWRQPPPDRETCVRFSNKPAAHWRGRMDLHGNTGPPVFTINRWLIFAESNTGQQSRFLIVQTWSNIIQTWTLLINAFDMEDIQCIWVSPHFSFTSACFLSHQVIFTAFMVTRWMYWNTWEVFLGLESLRVSDVDLQNTSQQRPKMTSSVKSSPIACLNRNL